MSPDELRQLTEDVLQNTCPNVILAGGCGVGALVSDDVRKSVVEIAKSLA